MLLDLLVPIQLHSTGQALRNEFLLIAALAVRKGISNIKPVLDGIKDGVNNSDKVLIKGLKCDTAVHCPCKLHCTVSIIVCKRRVTLGLLACTAELATSGMPIDTTGRCAARCTMCCRWLP